MVRRLITGIGVSAMIVLGGCTQREPFATAHTSKARHKATMRTYRVHGRTYRPTYVRVGDTQRGISSWYGPKFHGRYTSNGEVYNMYKMTAAHKTWPMDTVVRVRNLDNGRSTVVRINDRGPYVRGRIIDCSYAAGKKLGLARTGTAHVKLTVLGFAGKIYTPKPITPHASEAATPPVTPESVPEAVSPPQVLLSDFGVQVGAFGREEGAEKTRSYYQSFIGAAQRVVIRRIEDGEGGALYHVWVMGFPTDGEARDFIRDHAIDGAFLIRP